MALLIHSPYHVTGFWYPVYSSDLLRTGSVGVGICIEPGVLIRVEKGRGLFINGEKIDFKNTRELVESIRLNVKSKFHLGQGFAMSAIITLSASLANSLMVNESIYEAIIKAHKIEAENGTGLGDVMALFIGGGMIVRERPGPPSIGYAYPIKVDNKFSLLISSMGEMPTQRVLMEKHEELVKYGKQAMEAFLTSPSVEEFFLLAKEFTKKVGMLDHEIEEKLNKAGIEYYYKKKGALIMLVNKGEEEGALKMLKGLGIEAENFNFCSKGISVRLIED